jgi:hypothetical protein
MQERDDDLNEYNRARHYDRDAAGAILEEVSERLDISTIDAKEDKAPKTLRSRSHA